mmetsp:Transcript_5605/g.13039  ORF Transcript_5605/g.13039 Transcript_5605/m.13039 type:complete len:96 (-) Transcript_5605:1600-1887(-)
MCATIPYISIGSVVRILLILTRVGPRVKLICECRSHLTFTPSFRHIVSDNEQENKGVRMGIGKVSAFLSHLLKKTTSRLTPFCGDGGRQQQCSID